MDRFRTTLCLNAVRTADDTPLHAVDAQTLSLNGKLINADDVVECALPSRVATAIESSIAAAPAYAFSVFFLLGAQVHHGRLGDAVVSYVIRDQARHRSLLYDRQVSQRPVVTVPSVISLPGDGDKHAGEAPLQYEECLLFAYDNGAVACETLRATDTAATVDEVLGALRVISFSVFKYAQHKTCVLLVGTHLSTVHMATLLLASHRHVFLYVDATMTAHEVEATTTELQQVRESLCSFALPLDVDVRRARAAADAQASSHHDLIPFFVPESRILNAVAHSREEYELLRIAVALENAGSGAAGVRDAMRVLQAKHQRALEQARAAQEAAEAELEEQRQTHRDELLSLREDIRRIEDEQAAKQSVSADGESVVGGGGRPVAQNLLHSFQQQSQSHLQSSTTNDAVVAQLQHALQEALKAQKFAEEKVHLLELRQMMLNDKGNGGNRVPAAVPVFEANANGSVVSPRPSLRLPSAAAPVPAPAAPAATAAAAVVPSWEQSLLQQENAALVAEFQRREKEWQQRLRQASSEVAQLRQEKAAMEVTLRLQSQTITAAQKALIDSRAAQEQEMSQVLHRVRTLSQESRSRHRSHRASATRSSGSGGASDTLPAAYVVENSSNGQASSAAATRNGGMMSPTR